MTKFSFGPTDPGGSPLASDETQVTGTTTTGVKATADGISIRIDKAFGSDLESPAYAAGTFPVFGFSEMAWRSTSRTALGGDGTAVFSIIGLTPAAQYNIKIAGKESQPERDTRYTFPSGTFDYDANDGNTESPNAPVSTTETADVNGEIEVTVEKTPTGQIYGYVSVLSVEAAAPAGPDYTNRKGSTLDNVTHGLGTLTTATLNSVNVFDHVSSQAAGTVSFTGAITDEIATSGEYDLVLGDGTGTETITVQVNVYGVAPSNNPLQKDGSALASLSNVEVRVTDGANINGTELYYSGTGTTDASGNLSNIDLSSTSAADTDPVLLHMRTSAGDSIIASETVELI